MLKMVSNYLFVTVLDSMAIMVSARHYFRCSALGHQVAEGSFTSAPMLEKEMHVARKGSSAP